MAVHRNDRIGSSFNVDTSDVRAFVKDLRRASPVAASGMRRVVKGAAEIVAAEARSRASAHSRSIPPTIKARTYLSGSRGAVASVTAGKGVPLAALYELGNKGASANSPTFRHPVFERGASGALQQTGDWVDEPRFPYLLPAAEAKGAEVEAALVELAGTVADAIGRL